MEGYAAREAAAGLSRETVSNHVTLPARRSSAHAIRPGWCGPQSRRRSRLPPGDRDGTRTCARSSVEELEALLRAVPDDELGPTDRVLYLTAAMTGMRHGELLALRWRDVDWTAGVVRVRRSYSAASSQRPKSRRSSAPSRWPIGVARRTRPPPQQSPFRGDDDLVFAHPLGGPYDASQAAQTLRRAALAERGPARVRFHDLRHTFGTRMAAAGAPLRAIQEWMGHRDYPTTSIYADYAPDPSGGAIYAARAFGEDDAISGISPEALSEDSDRVRSSDYGDSP